MQALVPWTYDNPHVQQNASLRSFSFLNRNLTIFQNFDEEISLDRNTDKKLWDGSFLLSRLIEADIIPIHKDWQILKCVELGAGTGLVSMVLKLKRAATVVATDMTTSTLQKNIAANDIDVCIETLEWGCDAHALFDKKWDLVFGSDIIYHPDTVNLLLSTLNKLCDHETDVYICYKARNLGESVFFNLARKIFVVDTTSISPLPDFRNPEHVLLHLKKIPA